MAATTRVSTPATIAPTTSTPRTTTATEPFPAFDSAPRTPTSLVEPPNPPLATVARDNNNLLRPLPPIAADLSPKSDHARSPAPLTGAAAMADVRRQNQQQDLRQGSRQTSPNPAVEAMQSLMGGGGISKPTDAPAPEKLSEPLRKAAEKIHISDGNSSQPASSHPSPTSLSSFGTMDNTAGTGLAMTATAGQPPHTSAPQYVAEPAQMLEPASFAAENGSLRPTANERGEEDGDEEDAAERANKAFSYPGPLDQHHLARREGAASAARGMSLPGVGYSQTSPKSPASSGKRHKCPYCSTDFTRHHNLKSHLLTHSQEKPYVCQTCQARFRRLHDLKRHTKLHTGERPHTCDKCGRRFARGDALARHNKGPGGCAGRRSSFGGDDDLDGTGEGMDGVEYTGGDGDDDDEDDDPTTADDTLGRRVSEPSRKRAHIETSHDGNRSVYRQHSSTYPPIQQHRIGDMGPPAVLHPAQHTSTSPQDLTSHSNPAQPQQQQQQQPPPPPGPLGSSYYSGFNQHSGGMTESPKPLSPGQPPDQHRLAVDPGSSASLNRNRSPSLTTQFQQAHFGRGSGGRTPPQPPPPAQQFPSTHPNPSAPQLPPLSLGGSASSQSRPGMQPSSGLSGPGPSMLHHQQVPPPPPTAGGISNPGSAASSHGQSSGSSLRELVGVAGSASASADADLWSHLRALESRFSRMSDEYELRISRLQEEVISLKGQLHSVAAGGGGAPGSYPGEPRY